MAKILLVDDDDLVRATVANILTDAGHFVEEAANGQEALELIPRGADAVMPGMDGIEALLAAAIFSTI